MSKENNKAPNFREIDCKSCSSCYHNRVGECDLYNFKLTNTNNVVCDDYTPNEEEDKEIEDQNRPINFFGLEPDCEFWSNLGCKCEKKKKKGKICRYFKQTQTRCLERKPKRKEDKIDISISAIRIQGCIDKTTPLIILERIQSTITSLIKEAKEGK